MSWNEDSEWDEEEVNRVRVDFDDVLAETKLAYLLLIGDEKHWIPKSRIDDAPVDLEKGFGAGSLTIPEWLADEKGLT